MTTILGDGTGAAGHDAAREQDAVIGRRALELLNEVARVATEGLDLHPMLQRITDLLVESFDWDHAAFSRLDREQGVFVVEAVSARVPSEIGPGHVQSLGVGVVGEVALTGRSVVLADVSRYPEYVPTSDGIRCEICTPILHAGQVVAILNVEDRRPRDIAADLPLLEAVARQIAGAIANARLHDELLRRAQQLELLTDLSRSALEAEELEPVLARVALRLRERFDLLMASFYFVGRALHLRRAQLVLDVHGDPDYVPLFPQTVAELAIPIQFHDRMLGVFNFEHDHPQVFSQETVSLLQALSDQLAGVIHLAALNGRLQETTEELEQANRRLQELNRTLEELSIADGLTGLANRRQFDRTIDLEWRRAIRAENPLALLIIDIDFFKRYNDTHGHLRGDAVLAEVARLLASAFTRAGDLVARYGGEEFAALLPDTTLEAAAELAEQARARVEAKAIPHPASDTARMVTVSVGVAATTPDPWRLPSSLIERADRALYTAKGSGRNCVRLAD